MVLWMLYKWRQAQAIVRTTVLQAQMVELAALVRVCQLTPTYLMSAQQLDWFQPRHSLLQLAVVHNTGMLQELEAGTVKSAAWPSAWVSSTKRAAISPQKHLDWDVPVEVVKQAINKFKTGAVNDTLCTRKCTRAARKPYSVLVGTWCCVDRAYHCACPEHIL